MRVLREEEESVTEVIGVLYTQETSVVLWSGAKSTSIPHVTYLHYSTNAEQTIVDGARSMFAPAVVVIYKFFNFFPNFFAVFSKMLPFISLVVYMYVCTCVHT